MFISPFFRTHRFIDKASVTPIDRALKDKTNSRFHPSQTESMRHRLLIVFHKRKSKSLACAIERFRYYAATCINPGSHSPANHFDDLVKYFMNVHCIVIKTFPSVAGSHVTPRKSRVGISGPITCAISRRESCERARSASGTLTRISNRVEMF